MKSSKPIIKTCNESEIFEQLLTLDNTSILELGCGKADLTRLIATTGHGRKITAAEVDKIQHSANLLIDDLPNVDFIMAGSEAIPAADESFDAVFMFKSLHHVPMALMGEALKEVKRVLRPGGMAYISEPIFDGDFNEVLRLFHDEQEVRAQAYHAIQHAIDNQDFYSVDEIFFNTPVVFESFEDFETKVINVTHSHHQLSAELNQTVKDQFSLNINSDGANFLIPIRVNLLQKLAAIANY